MVGTSHRLREHRRRYSIGDLGRSRVPLHPGARRPAACSPYGTKVPLLYYVSNFVIGGVFALFLIIVAGLRAPLRADATDSTAVKGMFRKEVEERKKTAHDQDPVDR